MRFSGKITDWNDDRGFGFVTPNGGGERAFVHINQFQSGSRRPVDGDLISYRAKKDASGRLQATAIGYAGQKSTVPGKPWIFPRAATGGAALAVVGAAYLANRIALPLAGVYLAASALSYLAYLFDKRAAGSGASRIPENTLHLYDLLGGWPGALIAQQQFRHKTIKRPFQIMFWTTVVLNLAAVGWLLTSATADAWLQQLVG